MSEQLLRFDKISIKDNERQLLDNCQGCLHVGDRVILTGTIGSGKSLLLLCLARLTVYQGDIFYRNTAADSIEIATWRSYVALVGQNAIMIGKTVLDNLMLPFGFAHHRQRHFDKQWHIAALAQLGKPPDFLEKSIHHLSGGEKQLVHFLRSLQLNPTILLLDEPTAALDDTSREALIHLLHTWQQQTGGAYLWISHHSEYSSTSNVRLWQMNQGRLSTDKALYANT